MNVNENNELLMKAYLKVKTNLEVDGYIISDYMNIEYGIQFLIYKNVWKGTMRIYANKKLQINYDLSLLKEESIINHIRTLLGHNELNEIGKHTSRNKSKEDDIFNFPIIGIDESGKGDYFGPLVIASVYVNSTTKPLLEISGVKDSKKLNDNQIINIARHIRNICCNQYSIIEISPETYNKLYSQFQLEGKNLNVLLAWGHAKALEELLAKVECKYALSDKFADEKFIISKLQERGKKISLRQEFRAEENIAVAAASILARERFLEKLKVSSNNLSINLPKGASKEVVVQAKIIVQKLGKETLAKIAKMHFKTTQSVLSI